LLDIHANLMILRLRFIQFLEESGRPRVGWVTAAGFRRTGAPPAHMQGMSRIGRADRILWGGPFFTGEASMSHTLANFPNCHFKYAADRRPGDVFEVDLPELGAPLRNPLARAA
jgi:hypothetical protein